MSEAPVKPRRSIRPGVVGSAAALTLVVTWAFILFGRDWGRGATDDIIYHSVAIHAFAEHFPHIDLSDYSSATTPGYHLLMAVCEVAGAERTALRLISSVYTIALVALLASLAVGRYGWGALVLILPFLASVYFIYSGIWLLPDNIAWLGVLVVLLLSLRPDPGWKIWLAASIALAVLIALRQSHIWAAAALWTSAWIGPPAQVPGPTGLFTRLGDRARRLVPSLLATVPATIVLAWLISLWGGLVPPTFQSQHKGPNPATPAFILTQIAILSLFFLPILMPRIKALLRDSRTLLAASVLFGILLGVLPATTESIEAGRNSGWWQMAGVFPVIAGRSVFILAGSTAGAAVTLAWLKLLAPRDRWVLGVALLAFTAAMTANLAAWQRYHEPMLLMLGLLALTRAPGLSMPETKKWALLGCAALSTLLAAVLAQSLLTAEPVNMDLMRAKTPRADQSAPRAIRPPVRAYAGLWSTGEARTPIMGRGGHGAHPDRSNEGTARDE